MFDRIAPRYDLLNRLLSFRRDVAWRRRVARCLPAGAGLAVLDLATGTADQLLSILECRPDVANAVGIDMAERMLDVGRAKLRGLSTSAQVTLAVGDATAIPFPDRSFDAVTISFGIRNVANVGTALREMLRVLRPGGRALILEFSLPARPALRPMYLFYLRHILPRLGALISGDGSAYRYLNTTIEAFPCGEDFCALMRGAGFSDVQAQPLTGGVATIYQGDRGAGSA
jgi:demethylmenaquinone methyltransferase / 2-methoxy-6-polyprenyl-1,4-benzoquinol methylase